MTILGSYNAEMDEVIERAISKYDDKKSEYGESWRDMDINQLNRR